MNNLDFPNVMSPGALQRQASYSRNSDSSTTSAETANVEALVTLVQDLNQQNHELLNRITVLEGELTRYKNEMPRGERASGVAPFSPNVDPMGDGLRDFPMPAAGAEGFTPEQVSNLLNQLEFAQQANQRQDIRVESLSTQLTSCQTQIEQLEAENDELQERCGNQLYRLNHLEDDCRDLRLRLQRQQRYTLQFKAALEKCLEVPPPSYGFFHAHDYAHAHDIVDSFQASPLNATSAGASVQSESSEPGAEEGNWLVQPLFPKVRTIKPWGTATFDAQSGSCQSNGGGDDNHGIRAGEAEETKLDLGMATTAVTSVSDRFQSTLLTLANEAQQGVQPSEAQTIGVETEPVFPVAKQEHDDGHADTDTSGVDEQPHGHASSMSISVAFDADAVETMGHQGTALVGEEEGASVVSRDAIAPFSSLYFASPEPDTAPEADAVAPSPTGDDKLWNSLVNLIDMSTADGLKIKGIDNFGEDDRPTPPQRPASTLANPWFEEDGQDTDNSTADQAADNELHSGHDATPLVLDSSVGENDKQQPPESVQARARELEQEAPKRSPRRVIELPSFLSPSVSVNPNPA